MSVVGIDLGNFNSVIAVARNRGIDVIVNEVSNRATPYVAFQEIVFYNNTCIFSVQGVGFFWSEATISWGACQNSSTSRFALQA